MKWALPIAALTIGAAVLLVGSSASAGGGTGGGSGGSGGRKELQGYLEASGLPPDWQQFFELVARGESGPRFDRSARRDTPEESDAATIAFDRNRNLFSSCEWPASAYTFGSGGWFAMIPANALAQFKGTPYLCWSPDVVLHDPAASIAAAVAFAKGLMEWQGYLKAPTFLNLRAMWGWPAMGGDAARMAKRRPVYEEQLQSIGIPVSLLSRTPSSLASVDPVEVYAKLSAYQKSR